MALRLARLETLAAVARHGSFSHAARELHLSQPAVSMQVRQLELALGLPLLERVGKRAFPTKAGELLLAHAGRALRELETGLEVVQQLSGIVAGRIRLGTSASFSIYLLPPALRRFRSRYPRTELTVVTGNAPEIARAVVGRELDVGIVSLPVRERELAVSPFYRDEVVAIAPPDRRWRRGHRAAARDLVSAPLILFERGATLRRVIDDWFRRAGEVPAAAMELGNTEAIKKLVEAGLGLSVTSWFGGATEGRRRKLAAARLDPPLYREIGVIRRRDKPRTPGVEAVLGTVEGLRRGVGDAQGGVARAEQAVGLVVEPARVAELERRPEPRRELGEEVAEPIGRLPEIGRELEEDRAELVPERAGGVAEVPERLVHVAEPGHVRDPLRRLQDEDEAGRRRVAPRRERPRVRHPVERRVDLDRREALDVPGEHLRGREVGGIERALPLGVVVPGRADAERQPRHASRGVAGAPRASATAGCTTWPRQMLTPFASAGFARVAAATPRVASSSAYGSVAFVSANVEVRGTSAGMLATP